MSWPEDMNVLRTKLSGLVLFLFFCFVNLVVLTYSFHDSSYIKISKCGKIRKRYNQVPHLTQDTNDKVTNLNSQLYTTNERQEVSPFPAGEHKAQINRRAQRHNKHKTEKKP